MGVYGSLTGVQVDLTQSTSSNGRPQVDVGQTLINGPAGTFEVVASASNGDGLSTGITAESGYYKIGTSTFNAGRAPAIFKNVSTALSTIVAVWTPASGKRWRLLKFKIDVTVEANLSAGADLTLDLQDVTTSIGLIHTIWVPTTSVTTGLGCFSTGVVDIGPVGIAAALINTALNIKLSAALVAGKCNVIAMGIEE